MALPASGPISLSDIMVEFLNGGCISSLSEQSMSNLALAQNPFYSYGSIIYVSQFYNSACPKGGGK